MSNLTGEVSIAEIQRFTPHRYPLLLLDRGQEFEPFSRMVGIKAISIDEPWFRGRTGGEVYFPDVLILEALGQVGGVMMSKSLGAEQTGKTVAFIAMDNVRFLRRARPGDVLRMPVTVTKYRDNFFRYHAEAYVDGRLVAECDFSGVALDAARPA
jgi:3-hydroxyacyl-[acyl-carrier-protein] dehydratase